MDFLSSESPRAGDQQALIRDGTKEIFSAEVYRFIVLSDESGECSIWMELFFNLSF